MTAIVNGTMYLYGGRKTIDSSQTSNTWTNDFLTLDLKETWQISSPRFSGLSQPSGPPALSLGQLWNSHDSLFLYGGQFSDNPQATPTSNSLWEYNIGSQEWIEHENPVTSEGENSDPAGRSVERASEGAGFGLANLGRGWYFGGHLDFLTTEGWSIQTPRIYLKSFVEFTFPGSSNSELSIQGAAPSGGAWRNMSEAGIQDRAGFTKRADGILVYVPGFGEEGILLSLAGGTNETFTQMNEVDIFDIAGSQWYKQATSGPTPGVRVNPCAVVAAAADGSSYNIHMFGGQNLIPYGNQTQYDDMWILTVPSFTWIQVPMDGQSVPYARAGHTCNIWDGQMVVVGGYTGTANALTCESPGVYVFNLSSLQWTNQYTALSSNENNKYSQQLSQKGVSANDGLEGSYDYQVPALVQSVIGGDGDGHATLTTPANAATNGPIASGQPITYTIEGDGNGGNTTHPGTSSGGSANRGAVIGAIVAGVIGFLLLILVIYFAVCIVIYRKQLALYRQHVALMQEQQSEKDASGSNSFYASHSPTASRARAGHETLMGPYHTSSTSGHRPSASVDTSGSSYHQPGTSSPNSSTEDLMADYQPSFWGWNGVLLHPRRSLRIVNRDEAPVRRDSE